ncbi:ATP-binding protein [Cryobacterium aureum]|uniref:ATP-binding protein n=1 Tax=Cryobacterium aureum TaxID=995037 RepID=UPI000CF3E4F0|nr:DUF87 domain-containing protein [Cryobacterium aureum]
MADPRLTDLLGVGVPSGTPDAERALSALSADPAPGARFRAPNVPGDNTWLRITAVPSAEEVDAFLAVLGSAGGGLANFTVLIQHGETTGIRLYLSGGHPAITARVRNQIAPRCDAVWEVPSRAWRSWAGFGISYRVQAELGRESAQKPQHTGLLEHLSTVTGTWCVVLEFRSVHQLEVRDAQQSAVTLSQVAAEHLTTALQEHANRTVTTVSAGWSRVQQWAAVLLAQLAQGGAVGAWKTAAWAFGAEQWTTHQVVAALRGAIPEEQGRRFMAFDAPIDAAASSDPLSMLSSPECSAMLASPRASLQGLAVRPAPPAARRPDTSGRSLTLGRSWSTDLPATIGLADLEGHAFVTGTTGSGKTTTLHRLLAEAWNGHGIPFLVIDPVKDEYTSAAALFRGGITSVSGGELSLNLLQPGRGEDPRRHLMQVAQAFRGSFSMPSPTPYVVTKLFDSIAMQPGGPDGTELHDVRDAVDPLVRSLGYAAEAQSNIRASLLTRLELLLAPTRAHRFAWSNSAMIDALFDRPTVVTLADLVDDEERSFVVLLLALATWSRARARKRPKAVEHLLVLEEAHRVLPEIPVAVASADGVGGSAQAASAELLTSMLAEVRSFGEQVIVVDQSPAKVAADVVRNTNLKIIHRTVAAEDQRTAGTSVGLRESEVGLLGSLARGQAILSTRQEPSPQTIAIDPATPTDLPARLRTVTRAVANWPCCGGAAPEQHFGAWRAAELADPLMALFVLACRVGDEDHADNARNAVLRRLRVHERSLNVRADCLAWAGLRRLFVAERQEGLLPRAAAVAGQLSTVFAIWLAEAPPFPGTATAFSVPRTGSNFLCPDCGRACHVRVPAWRAAQDGPRTGLLALAAPTWRSDLSSVADWAITERKRLGALLGESGTDTVIRCQVDQAVARFRLTADVADHLLNRAGISR